MKTQLIISKGQSIIVSDETISPGEVCFSVKADSIFRPDEYDIMSLVNESCKKIIAGTSDTSSIDFNGFEVECGIIDVEKLAEKYAKDAIEIDGPYSSGLFYGFLEGFKKSQSIDEKFSIEDIKKAFFEGVLLPNSKIDKLDDILNQVIQSLKKPKVFDIEVEMMLQTRHGTDWHDLPNQNSGREIDGIYRHIPKVTNNSIKITKVI